MDEDTKKYYQRFRSADLITSFTPEQKVMAAQRLCHGKIPIGVLLEIDIDRYRMVGWIDKAIIKHIGLSTYFEDVVLEDLIKIKGVGPKMVECITERFERWNEFKNWIGTE